MITILYIWGNNQLEHQIGAIIRINRIYQNLSVRFLANLAGIEHSQLSKIERGIIIPNRRIYLSIFNALDLEFENVDDYLKETFETVNELYYEIIYNPPTKDIFSHLETLNQQAHIKGFTVSILLINLIFSVLSKETMAIHELLRYLKVIEDSMSDHQKQLYYLYRGVYLTSIENLEAALLYLEKANQYPAFDIGQGICHHQKGIIYLKKGNYFKAHAHLHQAIEHFNQHHVFVRSANASIHLSQLYLLTHEYELACQILKELLHCKNYIYSQAIPFNDVAEYLLLLCLILEKEEEFFELYHYLEKEFKEYYTPRSFQYLLYFIGTYYYQNKKDASILKQLNSMKCTKEEKNVIRHFTIKHNSPMIPILKASLNHLKEHHILRLLIIWIIEKETA